MAHWTLADIDWQAFDRSRVEPELLRLAKAASLVEYNGSDYGRYLEGVFADDPDFRADAQRWATEEVQHGEALGRWAQLADQSWDFVAARKRFTEAFRVDINATRSVRGSRTGELIARCIVEVGTSSYYSALAEAAEEPVLQQICRKIAADEFRHYKLFYDAMKRYQRTEPLSRLRRLRVGAGRIFELEDDELAQAYHHANFHPAPYDRKRATDAYFQRAYALYRRPHWERALGMSLKAVGLKPGGMLHARLTDTVNWVVSRRAASLARAGA
jgi:rubrerythrin